MNKNICSCLVLLLVACLACADTRMYGYERSKNFYKVNWKDFMARATRGTNELIKMSTPYVVDHYPTGNVSEECTKSLSTYVDGIKNWKRWSFRMFDATGKIPSSFKKGAGIEFGSYDDCLRIEGPPGQPQFSGQFCMLHLQTSASLLLEEDSPFKEYASLLVPSLEKSKRMLNWHLGICAPSSCSQQDLYNIITAMTKPIKFANVSVTVSNCEKEGPKEWAEPTKLAISVLAGLLGLSLVSTVIDLKDQEGDRRLNASTFHKCLKALSISSNANKLFDKDRVDVEIRRIYGVLTVLCGCVIICNTILYPTPWKEMRYTSFRDLSMAVGFAYRFVVAMDAIFFVSGFLSIYLFRRIIEKSGGFTGIFNEILKSYFRVTAVGAFVMLLSFALPLIYYGPLWNQTWNGEMMKCQNSGWANMLNAQAYLPIQETCLLHTWYPALMIQCALASIPLMLLLLRYPKLGVTIGVLIPAYILTTEITISSRTLNSLHYFELIQVTVAKFYSKPLFYFLPYVLGILAGRISLHFKEQQLSKVLHVVGWILSAVVCVNVLGEGSVSELSQEPSTLDLAKRTFLVCIAFFWIVYASVVDGVVGRSLSSGALSPFIKVTYIAYLVHVLLINVREAALKERIYIGKLTLAIEATSHTVFSFIFGMVIHVIFELPFSRLFEIGMDDNNGGNTQTEQSEANIEHFEKKDS